MKLDLYRAHSAEYRATRAPALVHIKSAAYLAIEGRGAPGGKAFTEAIQALYGMAFTIKMARKKSGRDYAVCKLEGLWWSSRKSGDFLPEPRDQWNWKLLIRTPDFIRERDRTDALTVLAARGKTAPVKQVRLETLDEGPCVQMLHVGPYERESETIAVMKEFARASALVFTGRHHEVYLSDPRRVAPARLRTILRHPVREASR